MTLTRSPETDRASGSTPERCGICQDIIRAEQLIATIPCQHRFHTNCLSDLMKSTHICPICKKEFNPNSVSYEDNTLAAEMQAGGSAPNAEASAKPTGSTQNTAASRGASRKGRGKSGMHTRSQSRYYRDDSNGRVSLDSTGNYSAREEINVTNYIQSALQDQQRNMMAELTTFIKNSIETTIQTQLGALQLNTNNRETHNIPAAPSAAPSSAENVNRNFHSIFNDLESRSQIRSPNNRNVAPSKAANILSSWHLKFDGSKDSMNCNEFLYRLRSLTAQTLNNDYELLCDNLHLLFASKASDWFWNFHKKNYKFSWQAFCAAFQKRFDDSKDDFDLWELIRNRRQKENESFDDYQLAVEDIISRLSHEISEEKLIDILKRNAKSSLRFELLHLKIANRDELREEVRKHENFNTTNSFTRPRFGKGNVSELASDHEEAEDESISAIHRRALTCWNCDKTGHRFDDCLGERRVFCYGCGAKNIYKPRCNKCNPSENRKRDAQTNTLPAHPTSNEM